MLTKPNGNIYLTGFMGSGKTTSGKKLAKLLGANFIDLDFYLEQKEKLSIESIFESFGELAFRKMEQTALLEIISKESNTVIALGGGTICYENNLENIKNNGLLVFIDLPTATLAQRLEKSKVKRPLLKLMKEGDLILYINDKLNERKHFYEQAHIIISGISLTPQILQQKISDYKKHNN
ncbi:MAG: shikimate kinase [Bacteroidota bacterium]|nr:shikimate kinase [Bacteroidota bacterium]MDP3146354.1 shikimate kinase [Bacteroidota bacterium]MDP3556354.1 shikimate kinase [Bacteroidota bacterium]